MIAHRGASGYAPENTMAAFIKAVQLGITWVEFDVIQAASGELIVFHDDILDRVTNEKGPIVNYPFDYIRTLDAGSWFAADFSNEHIPTLGEVLKFLHAEKMNANVEIKAYPGQAEQIVFRILNEMSPYLSVQNSAILFSSFSIETLQLLRKFSPKCNLGLLLHELLPNWCEISTSLECVSVHLNNEIITPKTIRTVKEMDKSILCYTVNDPSRAIELFSWGVDAVFSDYPDLIVKETFKK